MKKTILIILILTLTTLGLLLIVSCEKEQPRFRVGVLLIGDADERSGYTYEHLRGIKEAVGYLNLASDCLIIEESVPDNDDAYIRSVIDSFISKGCQIIIGTSYGYMTSMKAAAIDNPHVIFTHATGSLDTLPEDEPGNMNNYFGRIYQAWYLAGIVAGLNIEEEDNVGFISSFGIENGECTSAINAFTLGLQSVNGNSKVYVRVLGAWYAPEKEIEYATKLIVDDQCEIIVTDTDTIGPAQVAKEHGKLSIGYNSDMALVLDPERSDAVLTSVLWNWSAYYKEAIKVALACFDSDYVFVSSEKWREFGNYYGNYSTGLYKIAEVSTNDVSNVEQIISLVEETFLQNPPEWQIFSDVQLHFEIVSGKYVLKLIERTLVDINGNIIEEINENDLREGMNYWLRGIVNRDDSE
ncbi:MAG: BMP family ABC transporter substrate-binding protein [Christensenellaceae bacterium]|jgi:basic membrane protein A|nr:BMP family ABC transporter substrate-binding protein [Christensenellaceae bacterium]